MKIIITEGGTAHNVGSMALIENAIKIARDCHPNCKITVLCVDSELVRNILYKDGIQDNITVMDDLFTIPSKSKIHKLYWFLCCILWIIYTRIILIFTKNISWGLCGKRKKIIQEVETAEYIYCIGAERINDIYYKTALLSLCALDTYLKMKKRLIHFSLTIGPVFYKSTITMAQHVLNNSYAIFVRDQKSYDILQNWRCKAKYIFNSYDIALLQSKNDTIAKNLMNEFNIKSDFIGVSVINWTFRKAKGPSKMPEYLKSHAQSLDYIIEKYNLNIVITPTVVGMKNIVNDDEIADEIIKLMKHPERVTTIHRLLSPVEMATLFSKCKFSIVTRMHAAILCTGAGKRPVIAINYLYKLREYMKNINFEDYSIDIDVINTEKLIKLIDKMIKDYNLNYDRLNHRQVILKNKLKDNIETVKKNVKIVI